MSNTFSTKRFGRLFKKHTAENFRNYGMSIAVLLGTLSIVMGLVAFLSSKAIDLNIQTSCFIFFLFAAGTIFTSNIFINYGEKKRAIASITLPASSTEKFLVGWLYSCPIFMVVFVAIFYLVVYTTLHAANWAGPKPHLLNIFSPDTPVYIFFIVFTALQSILLYGSIYFQKMHFIKTAFVFFITLALVVFINHQYLKVLFKEDLMVSPPFTGARFMYHSNFTLIDLPEWQQNWVIAPFIAVSILIWMAAYYRLKEKQV
jgi:hypothetical protein